MSSKETEPETLDNVAVIQASWEKVKALGYEKLYENQALMNHGKTVVSTVGTAVAELRDLDSLVPRLKALGKTHAGLGKGIEQTHYDLVGQSLILTLQQGLGEDFTPEVRQAWVDIYNVVSQTMQAGAVTEPVTHPSTPTSSPPSTAVITLSEGSYEGGVKGNIPHGKGKIVYSINDQKKRKSYEGDWVDGVRHGKGLLLWPDAQYDGEWENNKPRGIGKWVFPSGQLYEGEFKDGEKNGKGKHTWPSGNFYQGDFKDGKPHGRGTFVSTNGQKEEGEWKKGNKEGNHIVTSSTGIVTHIVWRNGKRQSSNPTSVLICLAVGGGMALAAFLFNSKNK